jgi:hypothetical protein
MTSSFVEANSLAPLYLRGNDPVQLATFDVPATTFDSTYTPLRLDTVEPPWSMLGTSTIRVLRVKRRL